jgi:hypothetical protein
VGLLHAISGFKGVDAVIDVDAFTIPLPGEMGLNSAPPSPIVTTLKCCQDSP